MSPEKEPTDYESAREDLTRSLESKRRYDYFYLEFLSAYLMQCFACCCKKRRCYKKRVKRLKRHELAMEQLTNETDFFNFLKLLRTIDFMSKLYLKEYQRGFIPYFKKHQLTELEGDRTKSVYDSQLSESKVDSLLDGQEAAERADQHIAELNLIETARELTFDQDPADLAIMFEVTGYQAERPDEEYFWANYESYRQAGWSEQMAIN